MSGFPGAGDGQNLDQLLAQLRNQGQQPPKPITLEPSHSYYNTNTNNSYGQAQYQQSRHYEQPSVISQAPTPPVLGPQPHHTSAIMSPADTPQPRGLPPLSGANNAARTSSLLNLLKFSAPSASPASSATQPAPIGTPLPPSREPSASYAAPEVHIRPSQAAGGSVDLLAALMGSKPAQNTSPQLPPAPQPPQSFGSAPPPPSDATQNYLLQLLNQPKAPRSTPTPPVKSSKVLTPSTKASTPTAEQVEQITQALGDSSLIDNMMGSSATEAIPSFGKENARRAPKSGSIFTYVNPFDQLAASSPRHRTPKAEDKSASASPALGIQILKREDQPTNKRKVDAETSTAGPAHSKQKLEERSQASSGPPTPLPDGRTQVEALISIGAQSSKETVTHAVKEVGGQVDKEVQDAIARAEADEAQAVIEKDLQDMFAAKTDKEFEEAAQVAAQDIKKELEKEQNNKALDDLPTPIAEAVKDIIDDTAHGHVADSWESADAEDSPVKEEDDAIIKVFNFPMRPWTSITIKESEEARPAFRDEAVIDIARLKKEFDQVDRTLVTASNNFIVYGMSKNGGVRIIRQDDGKDARLFTETHDRIFSVVTSASSADLKESIIGTGISGTVYWALVKDGERDHIEESHPEMFGFALPPLHSLETETPGGVLKTRARKSSNHPDFFAVGRGKFINIIWPSVIMKQSYLKDGKDRLVDVDRYLTKHNLRVNTGKAGKDFAFSEDDSTIVSLDKAGRVKFWDVRGLTKTDILGAPSHPQQVEIKEPLITFTTTPATDKAWPTSVLFVDKQRPYQRGGALRYLIVGMKQNHTLQLWDLALQKPVQEINLPHTKESDAVCSVVYHAATGMIVVGHPTRNSIYFLHLSAPKYNLPKSVTQAEYIEKLINGDPPKPESTAVISGMREYSFANKGVLRSLDILQTPNSANNSEPATLFELYCMHSKGVTCLNIKQADLGWTDENKVIHPVSAEKVGAITIESIKEIPTTIVPEVSETASQASAPIRIPSRPKEVKETQKDIPRKPVTTEVPAAPKVEDKIEKKEISPSNGGPSASGAEKSEKKKNSRRKNTDATTGTAHPSTPSKVPILDPNSMSRNGHKALPVANTPSDNSVAYSMPPQANAPDLQGYEKMLVSVLDKLFKDFRTDKQFQQTAYAANQDQMLRMISVVLNDNVENNLGRIISKAVHEDVLPVVSNVTAENVTERITPMIDGYVKRELPLALQKTLPDAISKALYQPQLLKLMSDALAKSVAFKVEEEFHTMLHNKVLPQFTNLTTQSIQKISADFQRQSAEQINMLERQRNVDAIKIDQLTQLVTGLSETVSSMAAAQTEFQGQFLKMQQEYRQASRQTETNVMTEGSVRSSTSDRNTPAAPAVDETYEKMYADISRSMESGDYETAVVQWLQTEREQDFFANYFSRFNPDFLRDMSPLLLLSLGATVSIEFEDSYLRERVSWMEAIVNTLLNHMTRGTLEEQVNALIPKIMGIYISRLEHLFMRVSQVAAQDPLLKRLSLLVSTANRVLDASRQPLETNAGMSSSGNGGGLSHHGL